MKTHLDCIPCFTLQALAAARFSSDDKKLHERVLRETLIMISKMDLELSPPAMGAKIHRLIRKLTGNSDPYHEVKVRSNDLAVRLMPAIKAKLDRALDRSELAVRFAIAANIIDFGPFANLREQDILEAIEQAAHTELRGDVEEFSHAVRKANDILYLVDNAGEIVFDRMLIEELLAEKIEKVTVVVRGSPTINDATRADAEAIGLVELVEVIDNGSDVPGTILVECSQEFRDRFQRADLIVAKGQGNYESLCDARKNAFYLFKVKCRLIAERVGCEVGSMVIARSSEKGVQVM
ncbi:MAG: DUF89 family protein [Planctomycetes bacterium]|nr:DUF89 family protein [Planctomycetota bacterium]